MRSIWSYYIDLLQKTQSIIIHMKKKLEVFYVLYMKETLTSIEIDDVLIELQNTIVSTTNINFNPICIDAIEFDYSTLNVSRPVFFIGGLPQMGGDILAKNIIEKISATDLK